MSANLSFALAITCIVPVLIGLLQYKRQGKLPSFYCIVLLAFIIELLAKYFIENKHRQGLITTYNVFIIVNYVLYCLYFIQQGILKSKTRFIVSLLSAMVYLCCLYYFKWTRVFMYAQAFNGITFCFLAIKQISEEFFITQMPLYKNSKVIIALGIVLQYLFFALQVLIMFITEIDKNTRANIYTFYEFVNALSFLLYAYAFLLKNKTQLNH